MGVRYDRCVSTSPPCCPANSTDFDDCHNHRLRIGVLHSSTDESSASRRIDPCAAQLLVVWRLSTKRNANGHTSEKYWVSIVCRCWSRRSHHECRSRGGHSRSNWTSYPKTLVTHRRHSYCHHK